VLPLPPPGAWPAVTTAHSGKERVTTSVPCPSHTHHVQRGSGESPPAQGEGGVGSHPMPNMHPPPMQGEQGVAVKRGSGAL